MTTNIKYSKVEQDFYAFSGGLDLLTPALELSPGKCFDAQNYEPQITGGYRRIDGYERFDGHVSPSSAPYYLFGLNGVTPMAEAAATNLVLYSQDLTNAAWSKSQGGAGSYPVVTGAYAAAPDGTTTACRVVMTCNAGTTTSDYSAFYQQIGVPVGQYCASIWLKSNTGANQLVAMYGPNTGMVVTVTSAWQRFNLVDTSNGSAYLVVGSRQGTGQVYSGSQPNLDILAWGEQIEVGSVATSYVMTTNATASHAAGSVGAINVGDNLIGAASGASCKVLQVTPTLVVGRVIGAFQVGESVTDSRAIGSVQTVGTTSSLPIMNGAPVPTDDANYALLAANDLRTNIGPVPGSGQVRGVKLYNGNVYAFRDNVAANAGLMYKATASGWQQVNFGFELLLTTLSHSSVVTFSGTTVTWNAHQMVNNQPLQFTTTGTFPTGIVANFTYYVIGATANGFSIASTVGGTAIAISGGSGTLTCTAMGATINAGAVVTGLTSGASATVAAALLRTGTWTINLVGNLVFASVAGVFNGSEILTINGIMVANTLASQTAISRLPGGTVEFCNINFTGSVTGTKMYGADGVNPAFEFDGTNYVVLHTGSTPDTPAHVINFKEMLFLGIQGNIVFAQPGNPYNWDPINGAGNIGVGDVVTGFLPQGGTYVTGSTMAIFSLGHLFTLYGSSVQDFRLVTSIWDMGFAPYTMQTVSNDSYGWTSRGIQTVISTLTFGDFDYNSVSHEIQPLINAKQGQAVASCSLHAKDQYRVFFADGTSIVVGLTGEKPNGIMSLRYNIGISCVSSDITAAGQEVTYIGSTNGYVYQDNIGTSQDGNPIEAWLRLPFNHSKSPRTRKRYRRAIFEGVVNSVAAVNISYDIGYGNPLVRPSASVADTTLAGGGGYWDQFTWDQFTWDAQIVSTPTVSLQGTEKNISFLIYSNYAQYPSHTFQGVTIVYSPWRLER